VKVTLVVGGRSLETWSKVHRDARDKCPESRSEIPIKHRPPKMSKGTSAFYGEGTGNWSTNGPVETLKSIHGTLCARLATDAEAKRLASSARNCNTTRRGNG
jgi:hypothetical protein